MKSFRYPLLCVLIVISVHLLLGLLSAEGQENITLERFIGGEGIWKDSKSGKYYVFRHARQGDRGAQILVEIKLSTDGQSYQRKNSSYLNKKQIALIPIIADGKIKSERFYNKPRISEEEIGLYYYLIGEKAEFGDKKLTLDHFKNDEGIWKEADGTLYKVGVIIKDEKAEYSLEKVKP